MENTAKEVFAKIMVYLLCKTVNPYNFRPDLDCWLFWIASDMPIFYYFYL
jgi:hypothetical protein